MSETLSNEELNAFRTGGSRGDLVDAYKKLRARIAKMEQERYEAINDRREQHQDLCKAVDDYEKCVAENQQLREALEAFKVLLDNETLVRNVENDDAPDWASRQLPLIAALKKMERALSTPAPSLADHDREVAERCATIADRIAAEYNGSGYMDWVERKCEECMESTANDIADAIRAEFRKGDK